MDKYVPMLLKGEKEEKKELTQEKREKVVLGDAREHLQKMPEEFHQSHRRQCPKCGYTEDYRSDNDEKWHVKKEDTPAIVAAEEQDLPLPPPSWRASRSGQKNGSC